MPLLVTLTPSESFLAMSLGQFRHIRTERRHRLAGNVRDTTILKRGEQFACGIDAMSASAEMAVCKLFGVYWSPSIDADKHDPDILPDWQVRYTPHANGCLIVRPGDLLEHRYLLVTSWRSGPFDFHVCGWIRGHDALAWPHEEQGRPATYWVPQHALSCEFDVPCTT